MKEQLNLEKIPDWARQMLEAIDSLFKIGDLSIVEWLRGAYLQGLITRDELGKLLAVTEGFYTKAS